MPVSLARASYHCDSCSLLRYNVHDVVRVADSESVYVCDICYATDAKRIARLYRMRLNCEMCNAVDSSYARIESVALLRRYKNVQNHSARLCFLCRASYRDYLKVRDNARRYKRVKLSQSIARRLLLAHSDETRRVDRRVYDYAAL